MSSNRTFCIKGGELKLFTLPEVTPPGGVTARLDSPVDLADSRPDQAVAGVRTGIASTVRRRAEISNLRSAALSEAFAGRRRGVCDSTGDREGLDYRV
jgi:hypothetical protein